MSRTGNEREKEQTNLEAWVPKTRLGKMIQEGKITTIEDVFLSGIKISESQIVDSLIPDLQEEVINVNLVQKQTDAGEKSRFKAIVAVGNRDGYIGLGSGKASQVRNAIEKAAANARLNIIPVKRGCGSWECGCGKPHSVPFQVEGKCGGVRVVIVPGPRGLGLVSSEVAKVILGLAGVKDLWMRSFGSTRTVPSYACAIFDGLRKTYNLITHSGLGEVKWRRKLKNANASSSLKSEEPSAHNKKHRETLEFLHLTHTNHAVLIDSRPAYKGMLQRVNSYITYGEPTKETVVMMLQKRARLSRRQKTNRRIHPENRLQINR